MKTIFVLFGIFCLSAVESRKCYNCGYKRLPNGETEQIGDEKFCADFAKPGDLLTDCNDPDDCCASMKEMHEILDEATNETSIEIIGRHGCGKDLNHVGDRDHYCSEHKDSCFNVDVSTLPHGDNVTITDIELCFCTTDECNAEDPIFPEPTTNQPTTASGNLHLASIFVTIFAVFFSFMTDDIYFDVGDVAISYWDNIIITTRTTM